MNIQLKKIAVLLMLGTCVSCGFLPHSSEGILSAPIATHTYLDKDTSALAVSASYGHVLGAEDVWHTVFYGPDSSGNSAVNGYALNAVSGNFSYSKSKKNMLYGFGAFGYFGTFRALSENNDIQPLKYYGLGLSGMVGLPFRAKLANWNILNLQSSFAYDFGDYVRIRPKDVFYDNENNIVGVPQNAVANHTVIYTGFELFKRRRVNLTADFGLLFSGFLQTKDGAYFLVSKGALGRYTISYNQFKLTLSTISRFQLMVWNVGFAYTF